jgi:hypothetical protein
MAPNWMATMNDLVNAFCSGGRPNNFSVMIMWPVEEIGRNSVSPSTNPIMIASIILIAVNYKKKFMQHKIKKR